MPLHASRSHGAFSAHAFRNPQTKPAHQPPIEVLETQAQRRCSKVVGGLSRHLRHRRGRCSAVRRLSWRAKSPWRSRFWSVHRLQSSKPAIVDVGARIHIAARLPKASERHLCGSSMKTGRKSPFKTPFVGIQAKPLGGGANGHSAVQKKQLTSRERKKMQKNSGAARASK